MAQPYFDIIRWEQYTEYAYGTLIAPTVANGHVYICAYPGQSGELEPDFPTDPSEIVYDGAITWKEYNPTGITFTGAFRPTHGIGYNDYERKRTYVQDIHYTDGGYVFVYNRGVKRNTRTIRYNIMTSSDLLLLYSFLEIIRGASHAFWFYDENGTANKAIVLNANDIVSVPTTYNLEGKIILEILLLPT